MGNLEVVKVWLRMVKFSRLAIGCYILLIFCFLTHSVSAQHALYYSIGNKEGLPSKEVYQLVQDNRGFIFIGCSAGLFKYDGFTFQPITHERVNAKAISHLLIGTDKSIWCQNFGGQIYRVQDDSLQIFRDFNHLNSTVPQFTVDSINRTWIALSTGLVKIDADGTEKEIKYPNGEQWYVTSIVSTTDLKIYFTVSNKGLYSLDTTLDKDSFHLVSNAKEFMQRCVTTVKGKELIVLTEEFAERNFAILSVQGQKVDVIKRIEANTLARDIYQVKRMHNDLWICSSSGAYRFYDNNTKYEHFIPNEDVTSVVRDHEENLWFSTLNNGIHVMPAQRIFQLKNSVLTAFNRNITSSTITPDGTIYIGSIHGDVYRMGTGKQPQKLRSAKENIYRRANKIIVSGKTIYVARGTDLSIYDEQGSEQIYRLPYVRDMVLMDSMLYFINSEGLGAFNLHTRKYHSLQRLSARKVLADTDTKTLTLITNRGLMVFKSGVLSELHINNQPVFATAFFLDGDILWVGTLNDGLYGIRDGKRIYHFNLDYPVKGSDIRSISMINAMLWVATDKGIYQIDKEKKSVSFSGWALQADFQGLQQVVAVNDTIFLTAQSGFYFFPEQHLSRTTPGPEVTILSVTVNGKERNASEELVLDPDENNLGFHFKALSFSSPQGISYNYRLQKHSTEWHVLPGSIDKVNFNALSPGMYAFEVTAVNGSGQSSIESKIVRFQILVPFWQRLWFQIIVVFGMVLIIGGVFWIRLKFHQRKAQTRYQLIQSQLTALKAQMNTHFMFNALNSIQDLVLRQDTRSSYQYLTKFSTLLRRILESSESLTIYLSQEIEVLTLYLDLETLRFGNDFNYTIEVDSEIDINTVRIPSMLIQPFAENAMKHGLFHKRGEKRLRIQFSLHDKLVCTITDNGVGRTRSAEIQKKLTLQHQSFATKATQKRFELFNELGNNSLEIVDMMEEGKPVGTKVILTLDVQS